MKVNDICTSIRAVQSLGRRGCSRVVLTMGRSGIVFLEGVNTFHVQAEEVTVVDTTVCTLLHYY